MRRKKTDIWIFNNIGEPVRIRERRIEHRLFIDIIVGEDAA